LCKKAVDVKTNSPAKLDNSEAYHLSIDPATQTITVEASKPPGAFYGVQTLLSLLAAKDGADSSVTLPKVVIKDAPRYPYRGMHVDVSRNFHGKDSILLLLDVMGMYKMNKFHFHLTDDEGWRLEIPGLEELTEVGTVVQQ
jgi:hexosaminidase